MVGHLVEDRNTIESFLQKKVISDGYTYKVVNCGAWEDTTKILMNFGEFKENDIVIVYSDSVKCKGFSNLSLEKIYEQNDLSLKWTDGCLHHCNQNVNEVIAEEIYKEILPDLSRDVYCSKSEWGGVKFNISNFVLDTYIKIFFDDYQRQQESINGAIIMNCNPFTKGHRYLIEWASRKVELLFIFVVSEDKSLFSFEERMEMVKNGVCDLSNVRVIPSGEFILSDCTFPQYFGKIEDDKMLINAEYDVRFWGKYIAQCLQIKYRFVGEENDEIGRAHV